MDFEAFRERQRTLDGMQDILLTWKKVQSDYYPDTPKYLQWLVFRTMLAYGLKAESYMTLDEDFSPLSCAGPDKPDICVFENSRGYALEVTERPLQGKIEHYSHIDWMLRRYSIQRGIGCLVTRVDTPGVPPEVWSAFRGELLHSGRLFMVCGVGFLMDLLDKAPKTCGQEFIDFLAEAEGIWTKSRDWREVRKHTVQLQESLLSKSRTNET